MVTIRGFEFPEDLYYWPEKHVWVRRMADGLVRFGLTPVAYHLLRDTLVSISAKSNILGREVPKGKSVAMVESLKYIGPLPAPFTGVVERFNEQVLAYPDAAVEDPYVTGWVAALRVADLESAAAELVTGEAAMAAYRALLEAQNISRD